MKYDIKGEIKDICEKHSLPYELVLEIATNYAIANFQNIVYAAVGSAFAGCVDDMERMRKELEKMSAIPKSTSDRRKAKNPGYAPNREQVICSAKIEFVESGRASIFFESLTERSYGFFSVRKVLTELEILALFFPAAALCSKVSEVGVSIAIPSNEVASRITDLSDMRRNAGNLVNYTYVLDVKRKVARKDEPFEVLSITPYEAVKNEPGE